MHQSKGWICLADIFFRKINPSGGTDNVTWQMARHRNSYVVWGWECCNVVYYLENMQCNLNNNLPLVLIINLSFDFLYNLILLHQNDNNMQAFNACLELQSTWPRRDLKQLNRRFRASCRERTYIRVKDK